MAILVENTTFASNSKCLEYLHKYIDFVSWAIGRQHQHFYTDQRQITVHYLAASLHSGASERHPLDRMPRRLPATSLDFQRHSL